MLVRAVVTSTLLLFGFVLPSTSSVAVEPALSADRPAETGSSVKHVETVTGPNTVEVPIESTLEVRAAAGWQFSDCSVLLNASSLVTQCGADSFIVTGSAFDSTISPVRVAVPLHSSTARLTVDYVIRLAAPAPPHAPDITVDLPLSSGAVNLVPISDFNLSCGLCTTDSATIEVRDVEPAEAGVASVTGTHLVFATHPNFQGPVEISLRAEDDLGQFSKTFIVTLHASVTDQSLFHGLHIQRPIQEHTFTVDDLLWAMPEASSDAIIAQCGSALHGTVTCQPGNAVHYEPPRSASGNDKLADQFSVQLVSSDGRQALASVTLFEELPGGSLTSLVRADGTERAKLELALPQPPPESEEAAGGATLEFSEIMNAVGAR